MKPREQKPRTELRRIGKKRQAELDAAGERAFSTFKKSEPSKRRAGRMGAMPQRSSKPKARKPIRKKPRSAKEYARIYGSEERVAWVKSQPCAVLEIVGDCAGPTVNAHTVSGGKGRKADAKHIAPLCDKHHRQFDDWNGRMVEPDVRATVVRAAATTEAAWPTEPAAAPSLSRVPDHD